MSDTTTSTEVRQGFKFMFARDKDGNNTTDPKKVATISSSRGNCTWKLGEWQAVDGEIVKCSNGFHMSHTPELARGFVRSGNIFGLMEARGDFVDDHEKSCSREMRLVAWWPAEARNVLGWSDQNVGDAKASDDYYTAQRAAENARSVARTAASDKHNAATRDARTAHRTAIMPAERDRDLAQEVAGIRSRADEATARAERDAAKAIADARYHAAVCLADSVHSHARRVAEDSYVEAVKPAQAALKAVTGPADAELAKANDASSAEYTTRATALREAYDAAQKVAQQANVKTMAGKLGKPAGGAIA